MPAFWGVVRSLPKREAFAAEQLGLRGFETFLPLIQTRRASAPLFASYFFVLIVEQWRSINTCFGVLGLVRVGDCPSKMPDREIERLQAMIVGGFVRLPDAPAKSARRFMKGELVRITGGPFEGVRAIHSGMRSGDRERILLSLLGSSARPVLIPSHQVAPDMTLATLLRAPRGVVDPIGVARRELALIEALRARPGAALGEIAKAAEHTRSATADRLRRLAARGAVVKVAGRWRLAGEEPDEPDEAALPKLEPADPSRWVRPIGRYLRIVTSEFACARYG
jgi:transcriptional antiterminator RfaH